MEFPREVFAQIMAFLPSPIKKPKHVYVIKQLRARYNREKPHLPVSSFFFWWATSHIYHVKWEYKTTLGRKVYLMRWARQSRLVQLKFNSLNLSDYQDIY